MPDPKSVVEHWFDAIEARDVERITGALADDVVMETESLRRPITGKALIRDLLATAMDAYESIRIDRRKIIASGRDVAALLHLRARFGRDLELLGETLPTAGKSVDLVGAVFVEVNEEGKIARIARVRDTLAVVQQLGLRPEQARTLAERFEEGEGEERGRAA